MFSIDIASVNDYFSELKKHEFFNPKLGEDNMYVINDVIGSGTMERMVLSDCVELNFTDMMFNQDILCDYEIGCNFFEFAYCVEGGISYGEYGTDEDVIINTGDIFYWKNGSKKGWIKYKKNIRYKMMAIIYKEKFFEDLVNDGKDIMSIMFGNCEKACTGFISTSELILGFNQIECLRSEPSSLHKHMYLYSKALEMAAIFIKDKQEMVNQLNKPFSFDKADIEKIHQAKEIVENNIVDPYSINGLSKIVRLNTFKLKSGFKQIHRETIFGYLRDCRMKKARYYIEFSDATILEIANQVGYSNPSHFSVAFKRKYGINPSELRNGVVKIPPRVEIDSQ